MIINIISFREYRPVAPIYDEVGNIIDLDASVTTRAQIEYEDESGSRRELEIPVWFSQFLKMQRDLTLVHIDDNIARRKLKAMGVSIDSLTSGYYSRLTWRVVRFVPS